MQAFGLLAAAAWICLAPVAAAQSLSQMAYRAVMARQPALADAAFAALPPQRPGVTDVYVVAFAGDGSNPVFLSEARQATEILSSALGARGALLLSNDPATRETALLAAPHNLDAVMRRLGGTLDPNEDVLVTFFTSHGTQEGLALNFPPYLETLYPVPRVTAALGASGVRHQIVIVSACHSGVFVDPLKSPGAMIITAARADRVSFGCDPKRDWTYFGEAFFANALRSAPALPRAFDEAKRLIAAWERRDGLEPSEPQFWAGPEILAKLETLPAQ